MRFVLATLVLVGACDRDASPTPQPPPTLACLEADCLPGFQVETIDSTPVASSEYKGRVTLVLFWASWCEPCTAEGPSLDAVYRRRKSDFALLGISRDTADAAAIRTFRDSHGISYPIVRSTDAIEQAFHTPEDVPTFLLYGKDGRLRWKMTGSLPASVLERELDLALR